VNAIDWQPKALRQLCRLDDQAGKQIRDFDGGVRIVSIEEVRKRDERTY
jgi:mRNA-degrading endonuclease RelE of RelBE toxin-antitoxin system